jgi:glycosyltransferase involved in cell wall biosynthesis
MSEPHRRPLCVQLLPETQDAGAENQARYLMEGLVERGEFDVELAYFSRGRGHDAFRELGIPMREIARRGRFRFDVFGRARRLRRAYAERRPDVLQTWLLEGNIVGLLAARAWRSTAVIISQRGSWNELDYGRHIRIERLLIGRADHAIANSPGGACVVERLGMDRDRVTVIANGIPPARVRVTEQRESLRARTGWRNREVVVWVGRANDPAAFAQKDFGGLLSAVGALRRSRPRVVLALVGLSADEIRAAGFSLPEWAQAIGWTDRAPDYINAADAVAISSRAEGHSNVADEALMLGVPVATTDCGGHCDAVRRAGGRVVPIGQPAKLAGALASLLTERPPAESIRRAALDAISVERMTARTSAVYDEVIARKLRS